jgi:hypothetical protein
MSGPRYETTSSGSAADVHPSAGEARATAQRITRSLRRALTDADVRQCVSDALSLDRLQRTPGEPLRAAFEALVRDASDRAPWGLDDPAAVVADLTSWAWRGDVDPALGFAVAASVLGEAHAHRGARPVAMVAVDDPLDPARALGDVLGHRLAEAEARARKIARECGCDALVREVFLPAVASNLAALGDAAAQVVRGWTLAARFPDAAEDVMAATAVMLTVTHGCVRSGGGFDPVASSSRAPRDDARGALFALARAAATRIRALPAGPASRGDSSHHDLSRALRMAHAALRLLPLCTADEGARLASQCAGVVERLRGPAAPRVTSCASEKPLEEALASRDLGAARAALSGLDAAAAFRRLAPFAASSSASRPYHIAITVQTVEGLRELAADDPAHADDYLDAGLSLTVPWRPERDLARVIDDLRGS